MAARKKREDTNILLQGQSIPLTIHRESRRNMRATVGRHGFVLRVPSWLSADEEEESFEWFEAWATRQVAGKQDFAKQFESRKYQDGDELIVGKRRYVLSISHQDRRTHVASLHGNTIRMRLGRSASGQGLEKAVRQLLSRTVAADFMPEISRRVQHMNEAHFGFVIKGVRLKYNQSNWGSCSARGNINLSTRLLFAPGEVIDYVILHELAHLRELNHSPAFWSIVRSVMPDYKNKERWLRDNRHHCDF